MNANDGIERRESITGDLRAPGRPSLSDSSSMFAPPEVALVNKLAFENLRQRPVRTFLSVLAIGVEVTMILTVVGISSELSTKQPVVLAELEPIF